MVDNQSAADFGARMNLDPREHTRPLADRAGGKRVSLFIKGVGQPVKKPRVKSGVKQYDLRVALGGRVALAESRHIII